jgi:hypothetical protein
MKKAPVGALLVRNLSRPHLSPRLSAEARSA